MKIHISLLVVVSSLIIFCEQSVFSQQMPLEKFIHEAGGKYNVYFTLEGAYSGDSYSEMLLAENISIQGLTNDVGSAISAITNADTNLAVIVDKAKKIYHIVDKRLLGIDDYAMVQTLDSIKFNGNAGDFIKKINEKFPNLISNTFYYGAVVIPNESTTISIDDKTISVRDALDDGVDLNGYNRLIWTSFTSLETRQTRIKFQGQRPPLEH